MQRKAKHAGPFKCRDKFDKVHVGKVYNNQWPVQLVALFQSRPGWDPIPGIGSQPIVHRCISDSDAFFIHYIIITYI